MIQITLNFKSIEAARAVLLDIPSSALVGGPAANEADAPVVSKKAEKVDVYEKRVQKAEKIEQVVEAPKPEPVATISSPKPTASVDYPTLQKAVFALAGKSRAAAAAVAGDFGVKTFKELPEAKWSDALDAVNAALAQAA